MGRMHGKKRGSRIDAAASGLAEVIASAAAAEKVLRDAYIRLFPALPDDLCQQFGDLSLLVEGWDSRRTLTAALVVAREIADGLRPVAAQVGARAAADADGVARFGLGVGLFAGVLKAVAARVSTLEQAELAPASEPVPAPADRGGREVV
jgi:hypothetical protein